jgi:molybdenum cofactor biosynthesis enzyme MoaA
MMARRDLPEQTEKLTAEIAETPGWIDEISLTDGGIFTIRGWARSLNGGPPRVFFAYDGVPYGSAVADVYRSDLATLDAAAGFAVPVPGDPERFDQKLFEAHLRDGTPLYKHENFLTWCVPPEFRASNDIDLLVSPYTASAFIEITSRCNLRCVYCAVSQPDYRGQDMERDLFDEVIRDLKARQIGFIIVNAHGETTIVPDWHYRVNELVAAGIELQIITNFARLLSPDELATMARMRTISISIDTHRPEVLRSIRRRVSLGNILINMTNTTAKAVELGLPPPKFTWNCVMTDKVAADFIDYLRFGLTLGVREFYVINLTKHDDVAGAENVNHVTTLPDSELQKFAQMLDQGREMIRVAGGYIDVAVGLVDTVKQELAARGLQ